MPLILHVVDSLFFASPKSKRVLMLAWRHMLLNRWFADSLYFATPKSRRVRLMLDGGAETDMVDLEPALHVKGLLPDPWVQHVVVPSFT